MEHTERNPGFTTGKVPSSLDTVKCPLTTSFTDITSPGTGSAIIQGLDSNPLDTGGIVGVGETDVSRLNASRVLIDDDGFEASISNANTRGLPDVFVYIVVCVDCRDSPALRFELEIDNRHGI